MVSKYLKLWVQNISINAAKKLLFTKTTNIVKLEQEIAKYRE